MLYSIPDRMLWGNVRRLGVTSQELRVCLRILYANLIHMWQGVRDRGLERQLEESGA